MYVHMYVHVDKLLRCKLYSLYSVGVYFVHTRAVSNAICLLDLLLMACSTYTCIHIQLVLHRGEAFRSHKVSTSSHRKHFIICLSSVQGTRYVLVGVHDCTIDPHFF